MIGVIQMNSEVRQFRFSKAVKSGFNDKDRKRIAGRFKKQFQKTGNRFMQMEIDGRMLVCNVTAKFFQIFAEIEW